MRRREICGISIAFVLWTSPALAQRTTGTLIGIVSDESAAMLPGVSITLTSNAVQGTPTTTTSAAGLYRFPSLPPGVYHLKFELAGFSTLERREIPVGVGATVEINVVMNLSGVEETVTVSGLAPVVDGTTNEVGANYTRDWVAAAPSRRNFYDFLNAAPGVSASIQAGGSRSTSFGSNVNDNVYLTDGTDFTQTEIGIAWGTPDIDTIQEIQVLNLGAPAEYGNVSGAVFNVVTRQGSNVYHGGGSLYFQHDNLTGRNTTDAIDGGLPYQLVRWWEATAQLGGPIKRDKLWFFVSGGGNERHDVQPGTDPDFPARSSGKRVFAKVNYSINPANQLTFSFHDNAYSNPERGSRLNAPSTISVEEGHSPAPNVTWTSAVSNTTYVEARVAGFYGIDHGGALEPNVARVQPRFIDLETDQITGGIYSWYDEEAPRVTASGKVSHLASDFLNGSHDFRLGVQYNAGSHNYGQGPNDYIYTYGSEPAFGYTQLPFSRGGSMQSVGVFADDSYRIGSRVTLNLGVRYDYSKAGFSSFDILDRGGHKTGESTPEVDKLFAWNSISPRIGIAYKLNETGRTVLKAHYGRYYRSIVTGEFDAAGAGISPRYEFSGTYDQAGNPIGLRLISDNSNLAIDPDFRNPYTDQYIGGVEYHGDERSGSAGQSCVQTWRALGRLAGYRGQLRGDELYRLGWTRGLGPNLHRVSTGQ